MDQETQKMIASQLCKPLGETGMEVARQMNYGNAGMNRFAIAQLSPEAGHHVLEIGMGNGHFAQEILEKAPDGLYTGVDYSATMVEAAQQLNAEWVEQGRMRFIEAEAQNLPFNDHYFDHVITVNTIYFWADPLQELREIRRVLKPKGTLALAIRPEEIMKNIPFTRYGFHLRKEKNILDLLDSSGFKEVEIRDFTEELQGIDALPTTLKTLVFICKA
ncbi:MAG TPA: class I SAM-dependent methyltransferase [Cryomorphaceae bacterium]|nr:hypothetical protein [Owenweeksia sp.]HAD97274.1 class I SAM-dependent methyltransferase [Cryomorphaceae bacterium]HBF20352.1 class I SAM-dependent methyltransferase [Cryomorphaceae bacterium]HCQ14838.1 class I SAM-dependent methyltransferase [Cryomorphaceae bacterium]|tara:strand:- start:1436 stop:2089 length:654 start_codon:yes stop_codon:yes gene_type:complete